MTAGVSCQDSARNIEVKAVRPVRLFPGMDWQQASVASPCPVGFLKREMPKQSGFPVRSGVVYAFGHGTEQSISTARFGF